jgi:hypothetical protein
VAVVGVGVIGMAAIIEFMPQPHTSTICIRRTRLHAQTSHMHRRVGARVTATVNHARTRVASGQYPMGYPRRRSSTLEFPHMPST